MQVKARAADLLTRTTKRKVAAVTMLVKARMKAADLLTRTTKTKRKRNQKEEMKRETKEKSLRIWKMKMKRETKMKKKNLRTWTTKTKRETKKKSPRTWTMKMKTRTRSPRTTQKMKRKAKITGLAVRMEMARITKRRRRKTIARTFDPFV